MTYTLHSGDFSNHADIIPMEEFGRQMGNRITEQKRGGGMDLLLDFS